MSTIRQTLDTFCRQNGKTYLLDQWDAARNEADTPWTVSYGSQRKVWWRCEKGHSWQAPVNSRLSGNGCPVCTGRLVVAGENSLADAAPELAAQWDTERNAPLTPGQVTAGTMRKVWWKCALGHSWRAAVSPRVRQGAGCPYCAGRKVLPGFNDLAPKAPAVAAQWHPALNGSLTPEMVTVSSHRRVWWQCPQGHVWKALVYSRTGKRGCGCPVCSGSLSGARRTRYEQMLREAQSKL